MKKVFIVLAMSIFVNVNASNHKVKETIKPIVKKEGPHGDCKRLADGMEEGNEGSAEWWSVYNKSFKHKVKHLLKAE